MRAFILGILIFAFCTPLSAQNRKCREKEVRFSRGKNSIVIRGQLEPCSHLSYKFRARAGQAMSAELTPTSNDLIFSIQGTKFLRDNGSFVLPGFSNFGAMEWSGKLPNDDVYEIWIARPPVSNSKQKRTKPFVLHVKIT